jgi:hypothetical protein
MPPPRASLLYMTIPGMLLLKGWDDDGPDQ